MLSKHIFMLHRQLTIFMLQCYPKIIFCHYKMSFISKAKNLLVDETLQDVNDLMSLISNKRADNRSDWPVIGFCLWNIINGDDDGLTAWLEFSDRSEKYSEVECICLWNRMRENNYTLGTLKYYAKKDNPATYENLCKRHGDRLINLAVEGDIRIWPKFSTTNTVKSLSSRRQTACGIDSSTTFGAIPDTYVAIPANEFQRQ